MQVSKVAFFQFLLGVSLYTNRVPKVIIAFLYCFSCISYWRAQLKSCGVREYLQYLTLKILLWNLFNLKMQYVPEVPSSGVAKSAWLLLYIADLCDRIGLLHEFAIYIRITR